MIPSAPSDEPETPPMPHLRALKRAIIPALLGLLASAPALIAPARAQAPSYATRPEVQAFIAELVTTEGFDGAALRRLFTQARYQARVIAAMSRPLIAPPQWHEYAPQFLNPARVEAGVAFWHENAA